MLNNKLSICIAAALGIASMPLFAGPGVNHNVSVTPVAGTATVDGDISEWNISNGSPDFSANMCTAGSIGADGNCEGNGKVQLSTMYSRYDCATNTMYVMVLREGDHWPDKSANDAWVKIYDLGQSPQVDGNSSTFSWVSPNGVEGSTLIGYEASFTLAAGTYNDVQVHLNVDSNTSSTGKNGDTMSVTIAKECTDDKCDYIYGVHDRGLNDSIIFKYHPLTGEFSQLGEVHKGADIEGLDISPSGRMYASAGDDTYAPGAIYEVDMKTGELEQIVVTNLEIDGISFDPVSGELNGWAQGAGFLLGLPGSENTGSQLINNHPEGNAINVVNYVEYEEEVEDLSWSNDGSILYFVENNHNGNDPDARADGVPQMMYVNSYDRATGTFAKVCEGSVVPEIEALEILQDGNLLIGYHNSRTQMVKIVDPNTCEVTLDAGLDGTPYTDIEGLAVCPPAQN